MENTGIIVDDDKDNQFVTVTSRRNKVKPKNKSQNIVPLTKPDFTDDNQFVLLDDDQDDDEKQFALMDADQDNDEKHQFVLMDANTADGKQFKSSKHKQNQMKQDEFPNPSATNGNQQQAMDSENSDEFNESITWNNQRDSTAGLEKEWRSDLHSDSSDHDVDHFDHDPEISDEDSESLDSESSTSIEDDEGNDFGFTGQDLEDAVGIRIGFMSRCGRLFEGTIVKVEPEAKSIQLSDVVEPGGVAKLRSGSRLLIQQGDIVLLKNLSGLHPEGSTMANQSFTSMSYLQALKSPASPRTAVQILSKTRDPNDWELDVISGFETGIPPIFNRIFGNKLQSWKGISDSESATLAKIKQLGDNGLRRGNYKKFFRFLLFAQEFCSEAEMANFDMHSVKITHTVEQLLHSKNLFIIQVPGIIDKYPSVSKGARLLVYKGNKCYQMSVFKTAGVDVFLNGPNDEQEFIKEFFCNDLTSARMCHSLQFLLNRWTLLAMQRALDHLQSHILMAIFPPDEVSFSRPAPTDEKMRFFNSCITENREQKQAVCNIVHGSSSPYPYILFGPPGTGKTVTLVEAIKQVWKRIKGSRIVVATPSNSTADLIAKQLLVDVPSKDLVRLYAPSRMEDDVITGLKDVSQYKVSMRKLFKVRIICMTLGTSARLLLEGVKPGFFSHFFIDEAGQATEPESLIPLCGLLDSKGHVILSGDPHQLGPVVSHRISSEFGFNGLNLSLLERLMTTAKIYKADSNGNLNCRLITKLCKNFRSHSALLKIPNDLFYNQELVTCGDHKMVSQLENLSWLPKKGFPFIFHGVISKHRKGEFSPSLMNEREAFLVLHYVKKLLSSGVREADIGIVTPYRRQARHIRETLEQINSNKLKKLQIVVGSTEEFQGQERLVMILSTVRSSVSGSGLGFLVNEKRFNVAITRAQALQIVIGDPRIMSDDKSWSHLLQYCLSNQAYTGCQFKNGKAWKKKGNGKRPVL